ncbi:MAG: hypothetical protein K5678_05510 [Acetatifactor sp.]|nr:hypothetical protein [Acetatifactor sp.]
MKAKNIKSTLKVLSLLICTLIIVLIAKNTIASEKRIVCFYTGENSYVNNYLQNRINDIAHGIVMIEKQTKGDVTFGQPLEVLDSDSVYLVPIFMEDDCKYILTISVLHNNEVVSSFSEAGSEIINGLSDGRYYLQQSEGKIYIVGEEGSCLFGMETEDSSREDYPIFDNNLINGMETTNIRDYNEKVIVSTSEMRSIMSKELSAVPYNQNYGGANTSGEIFGCCWLSCAKSISEYYGATNFVWATIHDAIHDYWDGDGVFHHHLFYSCTGGTVADALMAIDLGSSKEPSYTHMGVSAPNTYTSIYNDIPIFAAWHDTDPDVVGGHATVITGYIFDNTTGSFTYSMMDPTCSSRVYVPSSYSATSLTYTASYTNQGQTIVKVYTWWKGAGGWH